MNRDGVPRVSGGAAGQPPQRAAPDILKLTLEEEGRGSRPMIPLMPVDLLEKITRYYRQHGIRTTVYVSSELRSLEAIYKDRVRYEERPPCRRERITAGGRQR